MFAVGDVLYKVVRGENAQSVLATQDPAIYGNAIRNGTPVTGKFPGTPVFAFLTRANAEAFAASKPDRRVLPVKAYGEIVIPERVLKLKMGWHDAAARFWADAKLGVTNIGYWPTEEASAGTVAVFGYIQFV